MALQNSFMTALAAFKIYLTNRELSLGTPVALRTIVIVTKRFHRRKSSKQIFVHSRNYEKKKFKKPYTVLQNVQI